MIESMAEMLDESRGLFTKDYGSTRYEEIDNVAEEQAFEKVYDAEFDKVK